MERAYNCPNRASRIFFKNAVVFNRLGHYGLKTVFPFFVNKHLVYDRENTNQTNANTKQNFKTKHTGVSRET